MQPPCKLPSVWIFHNPCTSPLLQRSACISNASPLSEMVAHKICASILSEERACHPWTRSFHKALCSTPVPSPFTGSYTQSAWKPLLKRSYVQPLCNSSCLYAPLCEYSSLEICVQPPCKPPSTYGLMKPLQVPFQRGLHPTFVQDPCHKKVHATPLNLLRGVCTQLPCKFPSM